jgi:glycosyltransferase involved in cell wall biosynthesis
MIDGLRGLGWNVDLLIVRLPDSDDTGALRRGWAGVTTQLRLLVRRRRPDVLYLRHHVLGSLTILLGWVRRVPVVVEVNGPVDEIFTTWPIARHVRRIARWSMTIQLARAAAVIGVTDLLAEEARQHGAQLVRVVPNGANTQRFRPGLDAMGGIEAPYACFFGSFAPWQGIGVMLEAVALPEWPQRLRLVMVGDGAERAAVTMAAAHNPQVIYLGRLEPDELARVVANAVVGLSPQHDPGGRLTTGLAPLKVYETLAAGVPVIVSDSPGVATEVAAHSCGMVVPPGDPMALAQAVADLVRDPVGARAMGERGRALVAQLHSWPARAAETGALLDGLGR